jgi:hypothetical protein
MNFDEALVIVYAHAVAGRITAEEEIVSGLDAKPLPKETVDKAFGVVEERMNKIVEAGKPKKRK